LAWFVVILAILFLVAGAALAYVVGAAAVLAFIATDNIRYLAGFAPAHLQSAGHIRPDGDGSFHHDRGGDEPHRGNPLSEGLKDSGIEGFGD